MSLFGSMQQSFLGGIYRSARYRSTRALRGFMAKHNRGARIVAHLQRAFALPPPSLTSNDQALVERLGIFHARWYCEQYPDVLSSGIDPYVHYMQYGWREGRRPSSAFDPDGYARLEGSFSPRDHNPIIHLLQVGFGNPAVCSWLDANKQQGRGAQSPSIRLQNGVCLIGYLRSEIGLGQAARNLAYACDADQLPISFRQVPLPGRENDAEFRTKCTNVPDRRATLLVTGLPSILDLQQEIGPGRVNILYPFWELARIPNDWLEVARRFDEIWAPSAFIARSFPPNFGRPVRLVPQPVRTSDVPAINSAAAGSLRFYTYLDFDSHSTRKNSIAAIQAFRSAFPKAQRDVTLIVKARGGQDSGMRERLRGVAAQDPRIEVIDRTLDRAQMDSLMQSCDVYISLHRSEGFGFGAAEALAAGKPVVSTDYGGTTDFITPETGYPIAYDLVALKRGDYPGWENQVWADPKMDATVDAFRAIYADPSAATAKAMRGRSLLHERFAPAVVGAQVRALLVNLGCLEQ